MIFRLNARLRGVHGAYAAAHYGKSLFWYSAELLFGFYLAELYHIPPSTLGVLLFVFLLWDALTDPLMGLMVARRGISTRSLLTVQLLGAGLSAISFFLIFFKPPLNATSLIIYASIVGLVFRTAYTVFDVSQNALMKRLSLNAQDRLALSSLRAAFSAAATLTVSFATALVLRNDELEARALGFSIAAAVFVVLALATSSLLRHAGRNFNEDATSPQLHFQKSFVLTLFSKELAPVFAATFFLSIGWPLFGKLVPFFATYVLENAQTTGILFAVMAGGAFISQPLWLALGRSLSRNALIVVTVGLLCAASIPFALAARSSTMISIGSIILMSAATSGVNVLVWAILADRLTQKNLDGANDVLAFGALTFASKTAFGFGGLALGWTLELSGYQPGAGLSASGENILFHVMAAAPAATAVVAGAALLWRLKPS